MRVVTRWCVSFFECRRSRRVIRVVYFYRLILCLPVYFVDLHWLIGNGLELVVARDLAAHLAHHPSQIGRKLP